MPIPDRLAAALADRYRVERELGTGGMATVYLAADLKHDRRVAIKVLKPELAAVLGAERFVVEIKTTASLQHPHILPLFDSGEAGGFLYYVMPFVEGETLRATLDRERQLSVDEALRITTHVADALDYAHRHGVIHRDIKPENILLHDGRPVVADFGIALAVSAAAGGRMTETGLSLGTPHYMSPEQATADREITGRTDQYSLASVLYEMLTGDPPHVGSTAQQIIMKIITEPAAPVTQVRRNVPAHVAAAIAQALEKLPADRFESAKAFADALHDAAFSRHATGVGFVSAGGARPWIRQGYSRAAIAAMLLMTTALGWIASRPARGAGTPPAMIAFTLMDSGPGWFDVARDGSIAYTLDGKLYLRRSGESAATAMSIAQRVVGPPVFSPDGRDLVVATEVADSPGLTIINRVAASGGALVPLFKGAGGFPMPQAWTVDGWIYADETPEEKRDSTRLVRFRDSGGGSEIVYRGRLWPVTALPGGRALVGCTRTDRATNRLIALDLTTGDTTHLAEEACAAVWSPTGHLLAVLDDATLRAIPFNPRALRATGGPIVLLSDVGSEARLTSDGTLLYHRGTPRTSVVFEYEMLGRDGRRTVLPVARGRLGLAAFSPDGRSLAYTRDQALVIQDLNLGTTTRIADVAFAPQWSPDGKHLAYAGRSNGLVARQVDPLGPEILIDSSAVRFPTQWLADGSILATRESSPVLGWDIAVYRADRPLESRAILSADWGEGDAKISPDGRWIAYVSEEPGWNQLTVRTWPDLGPKTVLADSVATWSVHWAPDGSALYYGRGRRVLAAPFSPSSPRRQATHRVVADSVWRLSDVHPDGRLLLVRDLTGGRRFVRPFVGITGFTAQLQRAAANARR